MSWRLHSAVWVLMLLGSAAWSDTTYVVQSGDSLDAIARRHGVSAAAVIQYNSLREPDKLSVGQVLRIPERGTSGRTHVVREGETLGIIAQSYGVDLAALTDFNKLASEDRIRVGQVLQIPAPGARPKTRHVLPPEVQRELDRIRVTPRKWRYIVVHHSGTRNGSVRSMDAYHRQKRRMENGLAYHFVIGNGFGMPDGKIEMGGRWRRQIKGGHLASDALNEQSIGICLVGNFETDRPTAQQMRSLYGLVTYLEKRCGVGSGAVKTHRQINTKPTECPGRNFPVRALMDNI